MPVCRTKIQVLCERIQSTNQPCTLRVRDIVELDQTLQKCNTESLFERPLPLLNSFLSPNKIPNGAQTSNGDEAVQTSIVCLGALANVRAHFGKGWATLVPTLMVFWPNIYKWLEYLYYRFIRNGESESTAHRDTALFTIIGISRLHAEDKSLLALISHIPGFMEILVNSWIFSAQKRIDSGTEPVSATLYRYLNYLQLQEPVEHKDMFNEERCLGWVHLPQNVCDSADERAGLFARAALAHLVIDTEQQYLEGTVGDVNLFELISRGPAWPAARLHLRMLSKGSATWVSNTAASITRSTWPQSEFSVAVGCVSSCYKYLMTLEFIMAETWICKAIKGHLFNALFKTNTWLEDMDGDVREKFYDPIRTMCLHLLNNILPKYLICRSVLQISREELLGREFSREMANYTTLSGPLANGLLSFVALVEERWTIDKHLEDTYHRKFICHNPSCDKTGRERDFSKCAKCQRALYCSQNCQREHWTVEHGHKAICPQIKQTTSPPSKDPEQLRRQLRYERRVVDWEINQRTEEINESTSGFNQDVIQFTATLDFTRMPVEMRLEPFSETLPEETAWEDHVVNEWKRVTRMVMERPGEVLIVRSLLPNGSYKHTHLSALFMNVEEGGVRRLAGNTTSRVEDVGSESG